MSNNTSYDPSRYYGDYDPDTGDSIAEPSEQTVNSSNVVSSAYIARTYRKSFARILQSPDIRDAMWEALKTFNEQSLQLESKNDDELLESVLENLELELSKLKNPTGNPVAISKEELYNLFSSGELEKYVSVVDGELKIDYPKQMSALRNMLIKTLSIKQSNISFGQAFRHNLIVGVCRKEIRNIIKYMKVEAEYTALLREQIDFDDLEYSAKRLEDLEHVDWKGKELSSRYYLKVLTKIKKYKKIYNYYHSLLEKKEQDMLDELINTSDTDKETVTYLSEAIAQKMDQIPDEMIALGLDALANNIYVVGRVLGLAEYKENKHLVSGRVFDSPLEKALFGASMALRGLHFVSKMGTAPAYLYDTQVGHAVAGVSVGTFLAAQILHFASELKRNLHNEEFFTGKPWLKLFTEKLISFGEELSQVEGVQAIGGLYEKYFGNDTKHGDTEG